MVELVVARYKEDLSWLGNIPDAIRVTVYNKGGEMQPPRGRVIALPNIGREAHSYLQHIIRSYDSPADVTVFSQGKPFDHAPDFHKVLRELAAGAKEISDFQWFGFLLDTDDKRGRRLFVPWSKNPQGRELPLGEFYSVLFGVGSPETFRFYAGAQFAVTAGCLRNRPRAFYEKALELVEQNDLAPHCLERIWDRIFGVCGVTEEMLRGRETVYLKPIKRLQKPV